MRDSFFVCYIHHIHPSNFKPAILRPAMPQAKRPLEQLAGEEDATTPSPSKRNKLQPHLVCPFYARSPLEFHKCRPRPGEAGGKNKFMFTRHADMLQHYRRYHLLPLHCPRCWKVFKRADEEQDHARESNRCDLVPSPPFVGVSENQIKSMTRAPNMSLEERWRHDWTIIFPGIGEDQCVLGPYATINEDWIDIIIKCISKFQSTKPDLSPATFDAICQMFENQRLAAAPGPAAYAEPPAHAAREHVEGGLPGPVSDEFVHGYSGYLGEAEQGSSNVGQDFGVNPADLQLSDPTPETPNWNDFEFEGSDST